MRGTLLVDVDGIDVGGNCNDDNDDDDDDDDDAVGEDDDDGEDDVAAAVGSFCSKLTSNGLEIAMFADVDGCGCG